MKIHPRIVFVALGIAMGSIATIEAAHGSGSIHHQMRRAGFQKADRYLRALLRTGYARLPAGKFYITESVEIPDGGRFEGRGFGTELRAVGDFPAIRFNGVSNASLENLRLTRHRPAVAGANGVSIRGNDIRVEGVWIEGAFNAVLLETNDAEPSNRVSLRQVRANHEDATAASSQYGLQANTVFGLLVDDCHWQGAWLDGIKLRRRCRDVEIRKGSSSWNGASLGNGASGDGIDCFAGGENVTIDGTVFEGNGGNGIVIKTIGTFNPDYGRVRQYRISNVTAKANAGAGLTIEGVYDSSSTSTPRLANVAEDDRPRAHGISVSQCVFENNASHGIFLNGFNINVSDCLMRANGHEGVRVGENARDTVVSTSQILGCGTVAAGTKPAITIESAAARIHITKVLMDGIERGDSVDVASDADKAVLTKMHRNSIEVFGSATEIFVTDCQSSNASADSFDRPVLSFQTSGRLLLRHSGPVANPNTRYFFGGLGSTIQSTTTGTLWVKESGANGFTGWVAK